VTCSPVGEPTLRGAAATEALGASLRADWGAVGTVADGGVVLVADHARTGWQYAHWLVAHSTGHSVSRVRFGDQVWTADSGVWTRIDNAEPNRVVAEVYP